MKSCHIVMEYSSLTPFISNTALSIGGTAIPDASSALTTCMAV